MPECGDGYVNKEAGEWCEDEPGCVECDYVCGDGYVSPHEECDDGNTDGSDGCTDLCMEAVCGDYRTWEGYEECDAGPEGSDECSKYCKFTGCGDGVVNGAEQCDSGGVNTKDCDLNCTYPVCGDGVRNPYAYEECDDGNTVAKDGCSDTCQKEKCKKTWWGQIICT